ncbi:MAG: NADPH-dependent FMN reductase [Solirubrobacteraceae bacterium]
MPEQAARAIDPRASAAPQTTRILGISGSLRGGSYNRKLLAAARELAPPTAEIELWDGLKALQPFDADDEHAPGPTVLALRDAIRRADAVLIATPQYNASLPGQLKNALDWASRPYETNVLRGKLVAVIGASPSPSGAARAQSEARTVLGAIGADVLDAELAIARAYGHFDADGHLTALEDRHGLSQILELLIARANAPQLVAAA